MKTISRIKDGIIPRLNSIAAYAATLYYIEIMLLMLGVLALFGKTAAVSTGFILTALLTVHIIMLFLKKETSRRVHLYIMDFHAAGSLAFLAVVLFRGPGPDFTVAAIFVIRAVTLIIEVPILYLMTGRKAGLSFS